MQKPRAWLKRLAFAGQLTLIAIMMFVILDIFFQCYKRRYSPFCEVPKCCSDIYDCIFVIYHGEIRFV